MVKELLGSFGGSLAQGLGSGTAQWAVNSLFMDSPGQMGRNAREYLDEAFPGMNPWEQSGIPDRAADMSVGALNTRAQVQGHNLSWDTQTKNARAQHVADMTKEVGHAAAIASADSIFGTAEHAGIEGPGTAQRQAGVAERQAGAAEWQAGTASKQLGALLVRIGAEVRHMDAQAEKALAEMSVAYISALNTEEIYKQNQTHPCLLYTSPSPRDRTRSRMPSSA